MIELQKSILACGLMQPSLIPTIRQCVVRSQLQIGLQPIYDALCSLWDLKRDIDAQSLAAQAGVPIFEIIDLVQNVPSPGFLPTYLAQFEDQQVSANLQQVLVVADKLNKEGKTQEAIFEISDFIKKQQPQEKPVTDVLSEYYDEYAAAAERKGLTELVSGIEWVDRSVRLGYRKLFAIAARPGEGKTAFSLQLALGLAKTQKVTYFSLEMDQRDLILRGIANTQSIPLSQLITYKYPDISGAFGAFADHLKNLEIRRPRACNLFTIEAEAQRTKVIFIDQLSKIDEPYLKGENKANLYGRITNGLAKIANRHDCCIILCCQINRSGSDAPGLIHLKDSGSIEEDCDGVLIIHNDPMSNDSIITCAKNRSGEANHNGKFKFHRSLMKFSEVKPDHFSVSTVSQSTLPLKRK